MRLYDGEAIGRSGRGLPRPSRLIAVGTAIVMVVSLAACTQIREMVSNWEMLDEGTAKLNDDVVMAMYLSPQTFEWGAPGYVLLIDKGGQVSAIRTSGMDVADMVWDENGLFFSDTERDYRLDKSGLTTWDSPKTNLQIAMYSQPNGDSYVGVYNLGFGGTDSPFSYIEQVVHTSNDGAVRYDAPGYSTLTAQCGDEVFSVHEIGEPYLERAQVMGAKPRGAPPPYWPDMLSKIYPSPQTWPDAIRATDSVGMIAYGYAFRATCRGTRIISVNGGGVYHSPHVVVWPTVGGSPEFQLIRGPQGEVLKLEDDVAMAATSADWSRIDGELIWFGGDGIVRATDVITGFTVELWDSGTDMRRLPFNKVAFQDSDVYVLSTVGENSSTPFVKLRVHDLESGTTREILTMKLDVGKVGSTLVARDMEIRPGLSQWLADQGS